MISLTKEVLIFFTSLPLPEKSACKLQVLIHHCTAVTHITGDKGLAPNNPWLPLLAVNSGSDVDAAAPAGLAASHASLCLSPSEGVASGLHGCNWTGTLYKMNLYACNVRYREQKPVATGLRGPGRETVARLL